MRGRGVAVLVAAVAGAALAGCGSAEAPAKEPEVATLRSAAAPSVAASRSAERPRERLDMTAEEYEVLLEPYNKCMREQGFDPVDARKKAEAAADSAAGERAEQANRVCEPQFLPLPPWEKDPANPEARDFAVAVVKCLKGKGVEYVEVSDDGISIALGGEQNDRQSITIGMEHMSECERQTAAKS